MKLAAAGLFLACILIGAGLVQTKRKRWNVLVVSACSLRPDYLNAETTPAIYQWAENAFIFRQAFAEKPWENFIFESLLFIKKKFLIANGYADATQLFYVPPLQSDKKKRWYWPQKANLHYAEDLQSLRRVILEHRDRPFFVFTHLKYMHYPYLDDVNMTEADWQKLSPESRALLHSYLAHPSTFRSQLPFLELLLNDFQLAETELNVKDEVHSVAGLISDPARDKIWRRSPNFAKDLRLAQELYDLKLSRFDSMAADLLNLYGDRQLQNNTVVIFTGDHGEAFMEHGVIGHSVNVYDEMLRYPLMVKFPGQRHGQVIDTLTNHARMAQLVKGILSGQIGENNFVAAIEATADRYLISRNCADTQRAVHYEQWKWIQNVGGKNELYDLSSDPTERSNVIDQHPDIAWHLEEYLMDHLAALKTMSFMDRREKVCAVN